MVLDYSELAAAYAQYRRVHPEVLRSLRAAVSSESRILEVGCGTGNYLVAIRETVGCRCCGSDASAEMLSQARARNGQVQLMRGSGSGPLPVFVSGPPPRGALPRPRPFLPERFLERKFGPHEWFPCGGGNRICLGMPFALY
jgi:SAM-dependent methyltransferase